MGCYQKGDAVFAYLFEFANCFISFICGSSEIGFPENIVARSLVRSGFESVYFFVRTFSVSNFLPPSECLLISGYFHEL